MAPWSASSSASPARPRAPARIAVVGKYVHLRDSYKSLHEALVHGGIANDAASSSCYVDSEAREGRRRRARPSSSATATRSSCPAASASAAPRARSLAIRYAREQGVPFFGICLGMQLAVVEYARHVAGIARANSAEFDQRRPPSSTSCPSSARCATRARRCASGPTPARSPRAPSPPRPTARRRSPSATATATRSTTTTATRSRRGASCCRAPRPTSKLVEMVELRGTRTSWGASFTPSSSPGPMTPHPLFVRFVQAGLARAAERAGRVTPAEAPRAASSTLH
jgi:CTP synthase